jgi:5-methyltetrahydrofolate--homocysteine methyltransferase
VNPIIREPEATMTTRSGPMSETGPERGRFLTALTRGPLVLDAALGTRLLARGLDLRSDDPCLWNLTHPSEVLDIHERDVSAGAQALFSNTFGANRLWLAKYGRADAVDAINRRAVALARKAIGREGFVIGDIGPTAAEEPGAAAEQAAALLDAGVDALVFETYRAEPLLRVLRELRAAIGAPVPILASLWQWPEPPVTTARRLLDLGVAAVGINCQPGIDAAIALARRLDRAVSCPILVKPSASGDGAPDASSTPSAFAEAVPRLLGCNVRLLGGCCGTTEAHVSALARACSSYPRQKCTERIGVGP